MENKIPAPIDPRGLIDHREESRRARNKIPRHTPEFYAKLRVTLADPNIKSCAYLGFADFMVLEIMADEQQRRASAEGCSKNKAFSLFILNQISVNLNWGKFSPEICVERPSVIGAIIKDTLQNSASCVLDVSPA
jgi:hypothetical protein